MEKIKKTINPIRRNKITAYVLCLVFLVIMIHFSGNLIETRAVAEDTNLKFSDYTYYDANNQNRYEDFKVNNPIIRNADIIWMVNMNLDCENYSAPEVVDDPNNILVLVNKHRMLPISFVPKDLKEIGNGQSMRSEAADALAKLLADSKNAGMDIKLRTAYRSYKFQSTLYNEYKANDPEEVDTYSARPGYSEHQTGLAVDLNISYEGSLRKFIGTKEADWIAKNAYKYGFIIRYTDSNTHITGYMAEPWHIRYIGIEHSTKMKSEDIDSFEEYTAKYLNQGDN